MQHKGRLTGLSSELGQRARTNSEQLLAVTRTHGEWERDPEKIHITPGSVSITSGVWPDAGDEHRADLLGSRKRSCSRSSSPTTSTASRSTRPRPGSSELIEHPAEVLGFDDARHWSERTVIMLCMQTTDTSIELYWHDGLLRSRHGSGTPPSVHIPVDRGLRRPGGQARWTAARGRCCSRSSTATPRPTSSVGSRSATAAKAAPSTPTCACSASPGLHVMDGSVMPANPGVNPSLMITALAERAMSLWPNKGEADTRPPLGLRLRARRPGHAAPPSRARGRSGRAATRRQEGRRHPRLPVLNRDERRRR